MKVSFFTTIFTSVILSLLLLFTSCQKVAIQNEAELKTSNKEITNKINVWLNSQKLLNNKERVDIIQSLQNNLDLTNLRFEEGANDEKLIIVPINNNFKSQNNKDKNPINVLLITQNNSGEIIVGNIVQYIPVNSKLTVLPVNTFSKFYNLKNLDADTQITFLNITDEFLSEYKFIKGKINLFRLIKSKPTPKNQIANARCTYYYLVTWYTDGTVTWEFLFSSCDAICEQVRIVNDRAFRCGGGGGGIQGPIDNDDYNGIAEPKRITENIDDTCLKSTYLKVTSNSLSNALTDILSNTFGASKDFNLTFVDEDLQDYFKDGTHHGEIWPSGRMDLTITLNSGVLPNASREFTAATIYHEILHAYLTTQQMTDLLQHNYMAVNYASTLTNALLTAFPTLDPTDAKALAWGGLQSTNAFDSIRINNPTEYDNLRGINAQHRVSTKGTPCN